METAVPLVGTAVFLLVLGALAIRAKRCRKEINFSL